MLNKQKGNGYNHKLPNINKLRYIYHSKKKSCSEIAKMYDVTIGAVKIKLNRYGIDLRTCEESQKLIANYIKLTKNITIYLDGLLLGDGCISLSPDNKSACYVHTDKHKSYINFLINKFTLFGIKSSKIRKHFNGTYNFRTIYYRDFLSLRKRWYPNGRKRIPKSIELTPTTLFNWYIGDGSFRKGYNNTKKSERVMLCTEFDITGRKFISNRLNKLKVRNSIYSNGIYIKAESRGNFFRFMLCEDNIVPNCYQYKFPDGVIDIVK